MDRNGVVIGHELKTEKTRDGSRQYMAVKLELDPHGMADTDKASKAMLHLPPAVAVREYPIGTCVRFELSVTQLTLSLTDRIAADVVEKVNAGELGPDVTASLAPA